MNTPLTPKDCKDLVNNWRDSGKGFDDLVWAIYNYASEWRNKCSSLSCQIVELTVQRDELRRALDEKLRAVFPRVAVRCETCRGSGREILRIQRETITYGSQLCIDCSGRGWT